jgi:hypothetical protein
VTKGSLYTYKEYNVTKTLAGPLYQIEDVEKAVVPTNAPTGTASTSAGTVKYSGYYYIHQYAPAQSYIVNAGTMYHLSSSTVYPVYGTRWFLQDVTPNSSAKSLTFSFDGADGDVTAIDDVAAAAGSSNGNIYNMNGQMVRAYATSVAGLAKGMYIMNGKKYIVK